MKKLLITILLCLVLFTAGALAEDYIYISVYNGNNYSVIGFNDGQRTIPDGYGSGTVTYDQESNVLTLDNVYIRDGGIHYDGTRPLKVHAVGDSTITIGHSGYSAVAGNGIYYAALQAPDADMTISGECLVLKNSMLDGNGYAGLYVGGDLTIQSGRYHHFEGINSHDGVRVDGTMRVEGGAVAAEAYDTQNRLDTGYGINAKALYVGNQATYVLAYGEKQAAVSTGSLTGGKNVFVETTADNEPHKESTNVNGLPGYSMKNGFVHTANGELAHYVLMYPTIPETGDASTPILWMCMLALSAMGLAIMKKRSMA